MAKTCTRCLIRSSKAYECGPPSESLFNYIYLCLQRGERYYWLWEVATQIFIPRSRCPEEEAQAEPKKQYGPADGARGPWRVLESEARRSRVFTRSGLCPGGWD